MKGINKWALLLFAAMLLSHMVTAQITETGEAEKTPGKRMLRALTVAKKQVSNQLLCFTSTAAI